MDRTSLRLLQIRVLYNSLTTLLRIDNEELNCICCIFLFVCVLTIKLGLNIFFRLKAFSILFYKSIFLNIFISEELHFDIPFIHRRLNNHKNIREEMFSMEMAGFILNPIDFLRINLCKKLMAL